MAVEFYLEPVKAVRQEFALPDGTWDFAGRRARLQDIRGVRLLRMEGRRWPEPGRGSRNIKGSGEPRSLGKAIS
ncbi:hypothetical protein [Noviherbaspirillum autotrophicum]|uniref:PHB de-polymerase C-terminal domain-containing protein n=1 Tax=Noviherbaspirillum autotrophicum TaxID=709839 RepID=A0A0C1YPM4_9BURK|nr:hypothetical protein TSA66_19545 [Noviherbaspirillum autotrophicum]